MIPDFLNIMYLKTGNDVQRKVYHLLNEHQLLEILAVYNPVFVGTIPIEINIDNSDIDIIGETNDFVKAKLYLTEHFSHYPTFEIKSLNINHEDCLICNFIIDSFEVEIYLENKNSLQQNAYRHLLIEAALLEKFGESFRNEIIRLKKHGYKTEPAFAKLLGLKGNPYEALLHYKIA